jgi:hypothetical protein
MNRVRRALSAPLLIAIVAACSMLPSDSPVDPVRGALDRVVAHDLGAASQFVCAEQRNPADFPFSIPGIFAPVQGLPGFDVPRTMSVIEIDASGITLTEKPGNSDGAVVGLGGVLVERFDPAEVEALFRAYAAESGQPIEQDLLRETIDNVSQGDVRLDLREEVRVVRERGQWKVCPFPPTP